MHVVLHLSSDVEKFGAGLAISLTPLIYAVILGGASWNRRNSAAPRRQDGPGALLFSVLSSTGGLAVIFWAIPHLS